MANAGYTRALLKLSGEALAGKHRSGVDWATLDFVSRQIERAHHRGVAISVVVGGGNIWRGSAAAERGMERSSADYAGMLATLINSLALQDAMERLGIETRVLSALPVTAVAEPYIRRRAIRHLEKSRVVIFAAGTGNTHMTTDTAAALRAVEVGAEVLLMAKNRVDGIYDSDPQKHASATKLARVTYLQAINQRLGVMDSTAISICMENNLPILVFDLMAQDSLERALSGEPIGSLVTASAT